MSSPRRRRSAQLPLNEQGIRLGDVAQVTYDFPEQENFNFLNGVEALTVEVNKTSSANVLEVADRVKEELAAIESLPEAEGRPSFGSSPMRPGMCARDLGQLRNAGLLGGLLAIVAMYLFLRRFRTTALVAVAIPLSVIATFVLMYLMRQAGMKDLTLNVVSLAGLMLALGMLVDNSVVVIESIFRHRNELGEDSRTAALYGASEVALPILASTVTTMCVFLPLIFLTTGGRFKLYMQNIGLTICIVMVASLLVASDRGAHGGGLHAQGARRHGHRGSSMPSPGPMAVSWPFTLKHRFVFVLSILAMFAGVVYLFSTIEQSFSSRSLERESSSRSTLPGSTPWLRSNLSMTRSTASGRSAGRAGYLGYRLLL